MMSPRIPPEAHAIVSQMFVATADANYILARQAFFARLDFDFFWLVAHALEKYFKAILLLNGVSLKQDKTHNAAKLYEKVMGLEPRLPIVDLKDPMIEDLFWRKEDVPAYLKRLSDLGDPNNRYATYGYALLMDDLFKADQTIWMTRRCCRVFTQTIKRQGKDVTIDYVDVLNKSPDTWYLYTSFAIDKIMKLPGDDPEKVRFLYLNTAFAPDAEHELRSWRSSASESPFTDLLQRMKSATATPDVRARAAAIITWSIDHLPLGPNDRKRLQEHLDQYQASVAPPPTTP